MKVKRTIEIETENLRYGFEVGDQITIGHYTATCQATPGADVGLFFLDQYLDKAMQMNRRNTNLGGYADSDLRKELNSDKILKTFKGLELVPFENGDLLRLPFYGELFGHDDWYESGAVEPDSCEQLPLMKDRRNRIASRKGEEYEWGWLQNRRQESAADFCYVGYGGRASGWNASLSIGVRPAFLIKLS